MVFLPYFLNKKQDFQYNYICKVGVTLVKNGNHDL